MAMDEPSTDHGIDTEKCGTTIQSILVKHIQVRMKRSDRLVFNFTLLAKFQVVSHSGQIHLATGNIAHIVVPFLLTHFSKLAKILVVKIVRLKVNLPIIACCYWLFSKRHSFLRLENSP